MSTMTTAASTADTAIATFITAVKAYKAAAEVVRQADKVTDPYHEVKRGSRAISGHYLRGILAKDEVIRVMLGLALTETDAAFASLATIHAND